MGFKVILHAVGLHYFTALSPPRLGRKHMYCLPESCRRRQINPERYQPAHVSDDCSCQLVGPAEVDITGTLTNATFPLISVQGDSVDSIILKVIPFEKGVPFVAFSHVWADGLGNTKSQKLPACQLLRLRDMIKEVVSSVPMSADSKGFSASLGPLIWCDTICIPPHDPTLDVRYQFYRNVSMQYMRTVYAEATYVVALDKTLEHYDFGKIGFIEAAFRLIISPWSQRLWTYPEVLVASKPLIKFADRFVNVDELNGLVFEQRVQRIAFEGMGVELLTGIQSLRLRRPGATNNPAQRLASLCHALSTRDVSVPSDEAICLCTLLALDAKKVINVAEDRRMEAFWQALSELPSSIPGNVIFMLTEKLESSPFRWAPNSLLPSSSELGRSKLGNGPADWPCAIQSPHGLLVKFAAWGVEKGPAPLGFDDCLQHELGRRLEEYGGIVTLYVLDDEKQWWAGVIRDVDEQPVDPGEIAFEPERDLLIIREASDTPWCRVLLGHVTAGSRGNTIVRSKGIGGLAKESEPEQQYLNAALARANSLHRSGEKPVVLMEMWYRHLYEQQQRRPKWQNLFRAPGKSLLSSQDKRSRWPTRIPKHWTRGHPDPSVDALDAVDIIEQVGYDSQSFADRVAQFFLGRFLTVRTSFDEDTEWCVD